MSDVTLIAQLKFAAFGCVNRKRDHEFIASLCLAVGLKSFADHIRYVHDGATPCRGCPVLSALERFANDDTSWEDLCYAAQVLCLERDKESKRQAKRAAPYKPIKYVPLGGVDRGRSKEKPRAIPPDAQENAG